MTSEEKRRLYDLLRDKNPKTLRDIDLLLAWGLPVVLGEGRGTARVDLLASRKATVSLSLRFALEALHAGQDWAGAPLRDNGAARTASYVEVKALSCRESWREGKEETMIIEEDNQVGRLAVLTHVPQKRCSVGREPDGRVTNHPAFIRATCPEARRSTITWRAVISGIAARSCTRSSSAS